MMDGKPDWQCIEQLYHDALDLPASERAEFLARACEGQAALRREVESLLAAREEGGEFLRGAVAGEVASLREQLDSEEVAGRAALTQLGDLLRECATCGECGDGEPAVCPGCRGPLATLLPVERTVAGRYRIERRIGRGGMGTVYQATDLSLRRTVALKVLGTAFIGDATAMRRFEREARAAARLHHPNVVAIYDHGTTATGGAWLALEYVEGVTLREEMKRAGRLPLSAVYDWLEQIAAGVKAAHDAGIVHRDLKPENVMLVDALDGHRKVRILDFGLALLRRTDDAPWSEVRSLTAPGVIVGTPMYMAPEQFTGEADERTDIFALGAMLAEMLTGQHPFQRGNYQDTRQAIMRESYHLPGMNTAVRRLDAALQKCLAKEPRKRYARMEELQAELLPALRDCPTELSPVPSFAQRSWRAARTGLRMKWLWVGVAFVLLAWLVYRYAPARSSFETDVLPNLKFTSVDGWKAEPEQALGVLSSSPDGQQLAFAKVQNGQSDIYVKQVGGGEARQLTNDAWKDYSPLWSPDGRRIAYLSVRDGNTQVRLIPAAGGAGQLLCTLNGNANTYLSSWTRDGARIYYEFNGNLHGLDLASSTIRQLTNFPPSPTKNNLVVSGDDQWLAYQEKVAGILQIFVKPLSGGAPVQVTHEGEVNTEPLWLPDSRRLVYSSQRNGVKHLFVVARDGARPVQFTFGHESLVPWEVTMDGRKIFYVAKHVEASLYLLDARTGAERQFSSAILPQAFPAFAPDGQSLAYQESRLGEEIYGNALFLRSLAGGTAVHLSEPGFDLRWSPTGERIAFLREYEPNKYQLWTLRPDGTGAQLAVKAQINFLGYNLKPLGWNAPPNFSWSPDGRRLFYASDRSGASNLYSTTPDGADERQLTHNAAHDTDAQWRLLSPLPSPDGQQMIYLARRSAAGQRQRAIFLLAGAEPRLLWQTTESEVRLLGWAAAGDAAYFAASQNQRAGGLPEVRLFRLAIPPPAIRQPPAASPGTVGAVARFANAYLHTFALAPGAEQVAYVARQEETDNIWLASLSHGQPRRLTANTNSQLNLGCLVWAPQAEQLSFIKQSNTDSIWMIENFR